MSDLILFVYECSMIMNIPNLTFSLRQERSYVFIRLLFEHSLSGSLQD